MPLDPVPQCPACGSASRRHIGSRGDRPIPELLGGALATTKTEVMCCRSCRHIYVDPAPSSGMLEELYAGAANEYFAHLEESGDAGTIRLLSQWASPPGRLLDVGCGGGRLMQAAADAGWHPTGVEPTQEFARRAERYGPVHVGYLDGDFVRTCREASGASDDSDSRFDAITLMAVLEHVADPGAILRHARAVARSGAVLIAEVPNGHRPEAMLLDSALRLRRKPWTVRTAPLQSPFHLSEFSRRSLRTALRKAGWTPIHVAVTAGHNPYPVPPSARRLIRTVENIGNRIGMGLNMTVVARAGEPAPNAP